MMMGGNHNSKLEGCILFLIFLSSILLSNGSVQKLAKPRGTVKTIKAENGDVIDCVDIYKQPAFSHPLLQNHTIQIKPSSYPRELSAENSKVEPLPALLQYFQCPEGTIPISRTQINTPYSPAGLPLGRNSRNEFEIENPHEYSRVSMLPGQYFGAEARINVWKPATFGKEFSLAHIWLASGYHTDTNAMGAGWQVNGVYNQTRFFILWMNDHRTGCQNFKCPGFVQTSRYHTVDGILEPLSTYGGKQFEIYYKIYKDKKTGNWWLQVQNEVLGYWPGAIFTSLADSANRVIWGGEVLNSKPNGRHTSTQMGSGHFPEEGFRKACFFRNLGIIDKSGVMKSATALIMDGSKPYCYAVMVANHSLDFGTHFYVGGPGYSSFCPV